LMPASFVSSCCSAFSSAFAFSSKVARAMAIRGGHSHLPVPRSGSTAGRPCCSCTEST
jgi:hypothetical protein